MENFGISVKFQYDIDDFLEKNFSLHLGKSYKKKMKI